MHEDLDGQTSRGTAFPRCTSSGRQVLQQITASDTLEEFSAICNRRVVLFVKICLRYAYVLGVD